MKTKFKLFKEHLKRNRLKYILGLVLLIFIGGVSFKQILDRHSRPRKSKIEYIVVHYTANPNPGADAEMNARYLQKKREAGAHYIIDDDPDINEGVIVGVPESRVAYSVGDKKWFGFVPNPWHKGKIFNENSLSFEMCLGGGRNDSLIIERTAMFVAWQLINKSLYTSETKIVNGVTFTRKIPDLGRVVRHHDVSGKQCPRFYYKDKEWNEAKENRAFYIFKMKVEKYFNVRFKYDRNVKKSAADLAIPI
jgi:N-acetylmuramoyl-L-alanine amidase CwlA